MLWCKRVIADGAAGKSNRTATLIAASLRALGDLRDPELIPVFASLRDHSDTSVRSQAVKQIGRTFSIKAVPALIESLKDDYKPVVSSARESLQRIHDYLREKEKWEDLLPKDK